MIPGLLHGRLLGAGAVGGIIAAPVYQAVIAFDTDPSESQATAVFTMRPDGTWLGQGTGYADKSGLWYDPITASAGDSYEVRITATNTAGSSGVVDNAASDWIALSSARALSVMVQRFTSGSTTAEYSVKVEIRLTGGAIVSTGTFVLRATAEVATSSGGGGGCPAVDMWLGPGLLAGEATVGQSIDGVTGDHPETLTRLPVLHDQVSSQPCYRVVTSNGAACVLSESTPFTLRDGSTAYAGDMLGHEVLRDDGFGGLVWDEVVQCYPLGELEVVKISLGGHSLLAGENPLMRIVSHNQAKL